MQDNIKVSNDITLDIATGTNRKDKHWKNKKVLWSVLLNKLSKTHATAETGAEYDKATVDRQAEIKDIGGFVGGLLTGGRRLGSAVLHRSIITLDIDKAPMGFWEDFTMLFDYAACIYSTHKHRPESPRLRLIMPLAGPVDPCQYEAIGRWFAGKLGIEAFDDTGFQASRLMYWPSTSKDQPYEFEWQDGPLIKPGDILAKYADYKDASTWPVAAGIGEKVNREVKKQGDPLEKPGVIGAFCRCYSISQVIETFLPDVYNPTDQPDRFTYMQGSTAGGLVTYEDKFAYSHHGTDPTSGKLCNAFDLVRIHKFLDLDENVSNKSLKPPSFKAMMELAEKDQSVRIQRGMEKMTEALKEFGEPTLPEKDNTLILKELGLPELVEVDEGAGWMQELEHEKKTDLCKPTAKNIMLIFRNDPYLKGRFAFNEFENFPVVLGALPWQDITKDCPRGRFYTDADDSGLRIYFDTVYGIVSPNKIKDARNAVILENRFHPIRNYLAGLEWDGVERVDRLLIDYFGAEDSEYTRAVTRKWLVAACARVYEPGIKFDNVLTFVGVEDIFKSTFFRYLAAPWFSDNFSFHMIGKKEAVEQLAGAWIIEVAELTGLKKAEQEAVKGFIARQEDRMRWAFKEWITRNLRQCVFGASTNVDDFLQGATGNRRFWAVKTQVGRAVKNVLEDLQGERGQIWAEAMNYYREGESLYLSEDLKAQAREVQESHTEIDPRFSRIQKFLDEKITEDWDKLDQYEKREKLNDTLTAERTVIRKKVTIDEIWTVCFQAHPKDMNTNNTKPIHDIMRKIQGWEYRRIKVNGAVYRGYIRVNSRPFTL